MTDTRLVRRLILACAIPLALAAPAGAASAQTCTSLCGDCGWARKIVTDGFPYNSVDEIDLESCHWGTCSGCGILPDDSLLVHTAMTGVERAKSTLTHAAASNLAALMRDNDRVLLNPTRRSIQVMSCAKGIVIAHIPLPQGAYAMLIKATDAQLAVALARRWEAFIDASRDSRFAVAVPAN